jgi:hypothetical protein
MLAFTFVGGVNQELAAPSTPRDEAHAEPDKEQRSWLSNGFDTRRDLERERDTVERRGSLEAD